MLDYLSATVLIPEKKLLSWRVLTTIIFLACLLVANVLGQIGTTVRYRSASTIPLTGPLANQDRTGAHLTNPSFRPVGSLPATSVINPAGSVSPGGTGWASLNPRGSLLTPPEIDSWPGNQISMDLVDIPRPVQFRYLPRDSLCRWAQTGWQQLDVSLSQCGNGSSWRRFLQADKVLTLVREIAQDQINVDTLEQLQSTLKRYEIVLSRSEYASVRHLVGFRTVHNCLQELQFSINGDGHQRLKRSCEALIYALNRKPGGKDWVEFLALPKFASMSARPGVDNLPDDFQANCQLLFERAQKTLDKPEIYAAVIRLPEFEAMYANLQPLVGK